MLFFESSNLRALMENGGVLLLELFTSSSISLFKVRFPYERQALPLTPSYTLSRLALGVAWLGLAKEKLTGGTMLLSLLPLFKGVLVKLEEPSRPFDGLGLWMDSLLDFRGDLLDRATLFHGD